MKGNYSEINSTLQLLGQLSFNEKIKSDLKQDAEFDTILVSLSNKKITEILDTIDKTIYQNIKELVEQIKWNSNETTEKVHSTEETHGKEHIMISYNTASRELCLKIKEELESHGFKVWIDVNDIHGSSLDAMAKAVENSICVLMCVTEKYRQSINCQAEAQYAFKMNKKIIPLIMQKDYENVQGWLGIIIGDKIFINFMKYDYDECIRRLKHELDAVWNKSSITSAAVDTSSMVLKSTVRLESIKLDDRVSLVEEWTEALVKEWFAKNHLNQAIYAYLQPDSGAILKQIFQMKSNATEFYYQLMNKIEHVKIHDVLHFSACLDKLFIWRT